MPRTTKKPPPKRKRGATPTPPTHPKPEVQAELTEAAQDFTEKLSLCSRQERTFVLAKLDGYSNTESAEKAGYSKKTAREQGSRLLTRVHIDEAIKAGWVARGLGPQATLAGINELMEFDPADVTSYVNEVVSDWVEVLATDVLADVQRELEIVGQMLRDLPPAPPKRRRVRGEPAPEPAPDPHEIERETLQRQAASLKRREIELQVQVRRDPQATVMEKRARLKRVPYIDLEKVQEAGKTKFIDGIVQTPFGRNIKMVGRKEVLEMAARVHGLGRTNLAITGADGGPIRTRQEGMNLLEELDDEGLDALEAALERVHAAAGPGGGAG